MVQNRDITVGIFWEGGVGVCVWSWGLGSGMESVNLKYSSREQQPPPPPPDCSGWRAALEATGSRWVAQHGRVYVGRVLHVISLKSSEPYPPPPFCPPYQRKALMISGSHEICTACRSRPSRFTAPRLLLLPFNCPFLPPHPHPHHHLLHCGISLPSSLRNSLSITSV